ncbi:MAG: septum formation initiator family protein [Acetivibrionales bacterium]
MQKTLNWRRLRTRSGKKQRLNEELKREQEMIQSDEYKEKVAREKLGMVKKNERVFVDIGK